MAKAKELMAGIEAGEYDAAFTKLYGAQEGQLLRQRSRYCEAIQSFAGLYGEDRDIALYSAPGRTEIGGNHTDHNRGLVMAAAINLDVIAVVAQNGDDRIRVCSQGFSKADDVDIASLAVVEDEKGTSAALIRGVAAGIKNKGGAVGGFDAYTTSDVLKGSGLSSSAAFEVCIGAILNGEYNNWRFTPIEIGMIGQYAENVYYDKPSGLMDQLACAVGGAIKIDFKDPANPLVEKIPVDLAAYEYSLVITDTKGDHADLTADYASIPADMKGVAAFFGREVLREVEYEEFLRQIPAVRKASGDRAVLRAIHFFEECRRVEVLAKSLQTGVFEAFLQTVIEGGHSSSELNQNAYSPQNPAHQGLPLALAVSQLVLYGTGAWRLQGGGFAGTIQAFVPFELVDNYTEALQNIFGGDACHILSIRPVGITRVTPKLLM